MLTGTARPAAAHSAAGTQDPICRRYESNDVAIAPFVCLDHAPFQHSKPVRPGYLPVAQVGQLQRGTQVPDARKARYPGAAPPVCGKRVAEGAEAGGKSGGQRRRGALQTSTWAPALPSRLPLQSYCVAAGRVCEQPPLDSHQAPVRACWKPAWAALWPHVCSQAVAATFLPQYIPALRATMHPPQQVYEVSAVLENQLGGSGTPDWAEVHCTCPHAVKDGNVCKVSWCGGTSAAPPSPCSAPAIALLSGTSLPPALQHICALLLATLDPDEWAAAKRAELGAGGGPSPPADGGPSPPALAAVRAAAAAAAEARQAAAATGGVPRDATHAPPDTSQAVGGATQKRKRQLPSALLVAPPE